MPQPGDLIEINRGVYKHWALYIGNGEVIHLAPPSEVAGAGSSIFMSVMHNKAIVQRETLKEVAGTDKYCVNNLLDDKRKIKDVNEILWKAKSLVGTTLDYDIIQYNCEHFVTNLRYGEPHSQQVVDGAKAATGLVAVGAAAVGVAVLLSALFGGEKEEKKKEEPRLRYY